MVSMGSFPRLKSVQAEWAIGGREIPRAGLLGEQSKDILCGTQGPVGLGRFSQEWPFEENLTKRGLVKVKMGLFGDCSELEKDSRPTWICNSLLPLRSRLGEFLEPVKCRCRKRNP